MGRKPPASPAPPRELSVAAKTVWTTIHAGWALDDSARELLTIYLLARDRAAAARALVARDGMVLATTGKSTRVHPAVGVARDAETTMLRAWRQLGLDVAQPGSIGRPPGRGPA